MKNGQRLKGGIKLCKKGDSTITVARITACPRQQKDNDVKTEPGVCCTRVTLHFPHLLAEDGGQLGVTYPTASLLRIRVAATQSTGISKRRMRRQFYRLGRDHLVLLKSPRGSFQ